MMTALNKARTANFLRGIANALDGQARGEFKSVDFDAGWEVGDAYNKVSGELDLKLIDFLNQELPKHTEEEGLPFPMTGVVPGRD